MEKLLFLDLETTGLDPKTDLILEVGVMFVDFESLKVLETEQYLASYDADVAYRKANEYVQKMHTDNGLWALLRAPWTYPGRVGTLIDIEAALVASIERVCGEEKPRIAGFTPGFDRRFLEEQMPNVAAKISHRSFCCSTLRDLAKARGEDLMWRSTTAHRALADCAQARQLAVVFCEWCLL